MPHSNPRLPHSHPQAPYGCPIATPGPQHLHRHPHVPHNTPQAPSNTPKTPIATPSCPIAAPQPPNTPPPPPITHQLGKGQPRGGSRGGREVEDPQGVVIAAGQDAGAVGGPDGRGGGHPGIRVGGGRYGQARDPPPLPKGTQLAGTPNPPPSKGLSRLGPPTPPQSEPRYLGPPPKPAEGPRCRGTPPPQGDPGVWGGWGGGRGGGEGEVVLGGPFSHHLQPRRKLWGRWANSSRAPHTGRGGRPSS